LINNKKLNFFSFIKGTFGEVRKAIHKETGMIRAVKMILKTSTSPEEKERLLNEVNILKSLVSKFFERKKKIIFFNF